MPLPRIPALAVAASALALAAPARTADPARAADAASAASAASAAGSAAPKESVALRFAWPAGLAADVEYSRSRAQTGRPASEVRLRGKLAASARGKGLAVRYAGWTGVEGDTAALLRASEKVALVVDEAGHADSVEGIPAAVEALRKIPPFTDRSPQMSKVLELIPASLEKETRENWGLLVEMWADNDLELGETYVMDSSAPVPAISGATVRLRIQVKAERLLECPGSKDRRCVELWMRSEPDGEDLKRIATALMERLAAPKEAVQGALSQLGTVMEATVVSEPSTLVPRRLETKKTSRAAGPDGTSMTREDVQKWTFAYSGKP